MQQQNRNKSNLLWPLANGTAVNKGMSLAISCCEPPNRSAICLITTLILLVSTARRMQPTRQNTVRKREGEREKEGRKGREGTGIKEEQGRDGGPASRKGSRKRREGRRRREGR